MSGYFLWRNLNLKEISDGLNIYPMLCFICKSITEYAADPQNESGHAAARYPDLEPMLVTDAPFDAVIQAVQNAQPSTE